MKEIGKFLKENRQKLDLSISDISEITKMNVNIIKHIEEGNVSYFSNDLTYLRYYVRSYSNAVNVDFESIDKELNEVTLAYTQSLHTLKLDRFNELNKNIKGKNKAKNIAPSRGGIKVVRKSIDWTLVSLISIVTLITAFLIYSVVINLADKEPIDTTPPVIDIIPPTEKDPDKQEPIVEPEIEPVLIVKENPNTYLISNWQSQENFSIKTLFSKNTWVRVMVNDQVINIPNETFNEKTFKVGQELILNKTYTLNNEEIEFKANDVISIRYGIMSGNKFFINDEEYPLDESIANANGGTSVVFKLDVDVD